MITISLHCSLQIRIVYGGAMYIRRLHVYTSGINISIINTLHNTVVIMQLTTVSL